MLKTRVMPCLLLKGRGLVKTIRFKNANYIGDPINTIRIFNEKEVDELILLDITATPEGKRPSFQLIEEVASECFMPLTYGGGIRTIEDMRTIFSLGVEKIAINSFAHEDPTFITRCAHAFGSQSVIVSIDAKRSWRGTYRAHSRSGTMKSRQDAPEWARSAQALGAGEILLTSIDRDGTYDGYDIDLVHRVSSAVTIPVIACGGAGTIEDFTAAVTKGGASAVAAGSMVVYQGRHRGVLINFPSPEELEKALP